MVVEGVRSRTPRALRLLLGGRGPSTRWGSGAYGRGGREDLRGVLPGGQEVPRAGTGAPVRVGARCSGLRFDKSSLRRGTRYLARDLGYKPM
jgi:hypothetical protein